MASGEPCTAGWKSDRIILAFIEGFGGKWVELLKEAVPEGSHMALLRHAGYLLGIGALQDIQSGAQALA